MATQTREEEEQDLEEFRALHPAEQRVRHYQISRGGAARILDLHEGMGRLASEIAAHTKAQADATIALRAFTEAIGVLPKTRSLPPPRDKFPSILEEHEDDDKALRELKAKVTPLILERDAELAVLDWWKKLGRIAVVVLGLIVALAAVAGIVWALFRYAVAHAA